jgi:hypothetical protein
VQRYKLTGNGQSICYRNVEKLDLHRDLNRDLNRELHRELDRDVDSELNRDLDRELDRVSVASDIKCKHNESVPKVSGLCRTHSERF